MCFWIVNYRDNAYFGIEGKIFVTVRIQQAGSYSARQLHTQYGDFEEEGSGRISICNHKKSIPLLTHFGHSFKMGKG